MILKKLFCLIIVAFICSCNPMKKDLMKDRADDVKEVIVSKNNDGVFLVIKEEVFQAVSKSDQGGFRRISGYTEDRISSFEINTGALMKRVVMGERDENHCLFLGEINGKLWYKSVNEKLGVHARDPKTLDVIISQEDIIRANPFLAGNLSQPEWNSVQRFYGFDAMKIAPMISDNAGYVYYIDPVSLKAEKTSESIKAFEFDNNCISTSMNIDANTGINLQGSPRNNISYKGRDIKETSFLDGNFLKSSNIIYSDDADPKFLVPYREKIRMYNQQIDSLSNLLENTDTVSAGKNKMKSQMYSYRNIQRNIENLRRNIKYADDDIKRYSNVELFDILTKDNSVFVLSRSDVTDKAKALISKVKLNEDSTVTLSWQTELNNVYREPDKGFDKSSFEFVFSKGDPDLNTMRTVYYDNKLIFVFMLTATCIDTETGNVLWSIDL
jgi:hypothetical protein